ncbi:MAG: nuclear transport factor 2 family protein [Burkholderiales bacterium]|nr:nuclear transport factor 2 family protein [Burkholderiales bacterium]MDE1927810.1 nuclear transport factor 2 family protein [Burkholderiales bacterium]MDE2159913.1 nuclear transport factor 2 family protein [Burkholderiales bacterium]MDE2504214.1 nuclear transport factor 2 family protein [Burkholderiales bacterium]
MPTPPVAAWHELVRRRDPAGIDALLADAVVFWSPVVHAPQRGRAITTGYLTAALHVFCNDSFRYLREIVGASDAMLEFETTIDGIVVNGVDLLQWDAAGRITEFKVMVRPLKAITLIQEKMAARLAAAAARP